MLKLLSQDIICMRWASRCTLSFYFLSRDLVILRAVMFGTNRMSGSALPDQVVSSAALHHVSPLNEGGEKHIKMSQQWLKILYFIMSWNNLFTETEKQTNKNTVLSGEHWKLSGEGVVFKNDLVCMWLVLTADGDGW